MSENPRRSDWQVVGAVALIALGALLLLDNVQLPWLGIAREAFKMALDFVWPIALIALGALLLISARRDRAPFHHGHPEEGEHRLYRTRVDRMVGGVLGGVAQYLGVDSTWVRVAYVVLTVIAGFWTGVLVYIIGLVLIPEEPRHAGYQASWPETTQWGTGSGWTTPGPGSTETVQTPVNVPPSPDAPAAPATPPGPAPTAADAPPPPEAPTAG